MIAVCSDGHRHTVDYDGAGFAVYGFVVGFTGPCRWNRYRLSAYPPIRTDVEQ